MQNLALMRRNCSQSPLLEIGCDQGEMRLIVKGFSSGSLAYYRRAR